MIEYKKLSDVKLKDGEPFFVIRAQDFDSITALSFLTSIYGGEVMGKVSTEFYNWQQQNQELLKKRIETGKGLMMVKQKTEMKINLNIECVNTYSDEMDKAQLFITHGATSVTVNDENKKERASIEGIIGGGIVIKDQRTNKHWYLSPQAIWEAYENRNRIKKGNV